MQVKDLEGCVREITAGGVAHALDSAGGELGSRVLRLWGLGAALPLPKFFSDAAPGRARHQKNK